MTKKYDAIVIGAGIIGGAIGLELARKGYKTLNIDRLAAAGYGSTSASCAIIRVYYSTVDGTAMAYDGYHDWCNWAGYLGQTDDGPLAHFHKCGTLVMKTAGNGYCEPAMAIMRQLGIAFEQWTAAELTKRLPPYNLASFAPARLLDDDAFGQSNGGKIDGAVFYPCGGYINDPQLAARNLMSAAQAQGGDFLFNAQVTKILKQNNQITGVELADGQTLHAPIVVNVAGPHSSQINAMAGVLNEMKITTRPLRQEVVHVPSPEEFDFEAKGFVISDSDISVYARPETGGHILLGSEDPPCDAQEEVDPDEFDRELGVQGQTQLYRYAQRMPTVPISNRLKGVVDLYDVTEDWLPIYDASSIKGYFMAIGSSGNQFKNAPVAGRMMAHLIEQCSQGHDHDAEPLQFKLHHIDHSLDMASFSRKRQINPNSSFSVLG